MEQTENQLASYYPLPSLYGGLAFFGAHPQDYGKHQEYWFRKNEWRFHVSMPALCNARMPVDLDNIAGGCGVYFLFKGEVLQYVGQSRNIQYRVSQHLYSMRPLLDKADWFDSISAIWVPKDFLDRIEAIYIANHRPPMNSRRPVVLQRKKKARKSITPILTVPKDWKYDPEAIARKLDEVS